MIEDGVPFGADMERFIVEACWRMCNASVTCLSQVYGANATTLAESQSILCSLLHAWTAMLFFMSCLHTAYLCSVTLFYRVLPVSPMFTVSQSSHIIS